MSTTSLKNNRSLAGPLTFADQVEAASDGANVMSCYQCRKCTSGCPVAGRVDIKPHELVRLVQLGERDEVLASRMIWECTACETCISRCPQKVDIAGMIDALRRLSRQAGQADGSTTVPTFNDIFLNIVRKRGRMYEMGLMVSYKLRTRNLFADVGKFPMMLRKRKLALLPPKTDGKAERKRLFERAEQAGGQGK